MSDLIDRQAVINALEKVAELFPWRVPGNRDSYDHYNEAWNDAIGRAEIEIEKLPSAQPEVLACGEGELIPQPQRKKGKWIYLDKDKRFFHPHIVKCSVCDNTLDMYGVNAGRGDANFCPNCGADMREDGASNADVES